MKVYPKPYRPSGGEKQRILLAMALEKIGMLPAAGADGPETMFVFDEPSGSLDNRFRDIFLTELFSSYQRRPFTALVITHDYSMISRIAEEDAAVKQNVVLRELVRRDDRIALRDFDPARYTGWVRELERGNDAAPRSTDRAPVLTVDHTLAVFGRHLTISPDREGTRRTHLTLHAGSMVYLKAPSGTGKTTLVKRVMGLIGEGEVHASIRDLKVDAHTPRSFWQKNIWGRTMTMVFQHADEALNLQSTMRETFLGLPTRRPLTPDAIVTLAGELFDEDEIRELLPKKVRFLSGGQKQRLNLLRGLVLDTDILILDEPLNGLDFESCTRVVRMLQHKMAAGMAVLVISHNEEIFDALAGQRIYYLHVH
jgi:ABC-type dipeptide/oligopeptide/nickel transport system ATPase subunit